MRIIVILFVALLLAVTSFHLWMTQDNATPDQVVDDALGQSEVQIGGAFTLTDQDGKTVQESEFRGRVMLVFFGFTHCPDICPVTVATLDKTIALLGDKADKVVPIFITVDPERDTPEVLKVYLENFDKRFVGLTGAPEAITQVLTAYKAYAAKAEVLEPENDDNAEADHDPDDDTAQSAEYMMDHSGYIYLMDKSGAYSKIFSNTTSAQELANAVEQALAQ